MGTLRPLVLVVIASLALAPAAVAGGRGHGAGRGHAHNAIAGRLQSSVGRPGHFVPASLFTRQWYPPGHHGSHHSGSRHVGGSFVGVVAAPTVVYAPPLVYGAPAAYDPPVVYAPAPVSMVSLTPPPPPMPRVVEYSTGRYELRGDGSFTPYSWVWIPNPPPAPPPGPPPEAVTPVDSSRTRLSKLYRWTDEEGVVHFTDRWEAVPQRYRAEAKPPER